MEVVQAVGRLRYAASTRHRDEGKGMRTTNVGCWFVYILCCADGTFYTGITTDVSRRCRQHNAGTASRYTRCRLPTRLVYQESQPDRGTALRREAAIKTLSRREKGVLIRRGRRKAV